MKICIRFLDFTQWFEYKNSMANSERKKNNPGLFIFKEIFSGFYPVLAILLTILSFSLPVYAKTPVAINGIMDLTSWDFDRHGTVDLNGQWFFCPDEWLMPGAIENRPAPLFIEVPSSWNGYKMERGVLEENGFATYGLKLALPENTGPMALHIPEVGTAYTLFIDGRKEVTIGIPGKNIEDSEPRVEPVTIHFMPQNGVASIVFHVSNFDHRRGGLWETIHFGRPAVIHKDILNKAVLDLFLFGAILIMGLYNFGIYYFRKTDFAPLFFALFCFLVACRILVVDERLILNLLPALPTPLMYKIEYITFYLGCSTIFACLYFSYPEDFHQMVCRIFQGCMLAFSLSVLFFGMTVFTKTLKAFQILSLLLIFYCIYSLLLAFIRKRKGVKIFFLGFSVFALTVLNDILYANNVIHTMYLFHAGMLVFVICQSYNLARNFGLAYQTIDDQRQALDLKNRDLATELQRRKDAEALVKYNEDKYQQLTELLPGAVFETDDSGRILFANQAAGNMFGWYPSTRIRTFYLKDGISISSWDAFDSVYGQACRNRRVCELEISGQMAGHEPFPAIMFLCGVENQSGQFTGIRGIAIDLSHQKELEKRLRHAEKIEAIGTLAGGIAHDFNNILSIILGYAELTQIEIDEASSAGKNLDSIVSACLRARDLVNQILSYSRKDHYRKAPFKIESILASALKLIRATVPSNIEIKEVYSSKTYTVLVDATQIHQIVLNFTTNAIFAMKQTGGRLTISVQNIIIGAESSIFPEQLTPGDYVCMKFEDTGEGIKEENITKIFDPFFTTKGPGFGTGMGLSVVHGIVQEHGGVVTVDSSPGKGACFCVYLPALPGEFDMPEEILEHPVQKGFEHILFVDDESKIVSYSKEMLISLGYQVTALTSSMAAFDLIKKTPHVFDLVITDMTMPFLTGSALAAQIKHVRQDLPIIMCTGFSDQINEADAKKIGIEAFLMKPISKVDISRAIRKVLDEKRWNTV